MILFRPCCPSWEQEVLPFGQLQVSLRGFPESLLPQSKYQGSPERPVRLSDHQRGVKPLHLSSEDRQDLRHHSPFTERTQYCGMYRCVALLYRPPSHTSSPKAGNGQSLVTQLKRSFGDQLYKEASSSPISQPHQRL